MTLSEKDLRESVLMTLQPDVEQKREAERILDTLCGRPGFFDSLISLAARDTAAEVRLVAGILFRRYLERTWSNEGFAKTELIAAFPTVLLQTSPEAAPQLLAALDHILKSESASAWTGIIAAADSLIGAADSAAAITGLKILNRIILTFIEGYKSEKVFEPILDRSGARILALAGESLGSTAALAMKVLAHACESYVMPRVFTDAGFVQQAVAAAGKGTSPEASVSLTKWSLVLLNNLLKKTRRKKSLPAFAPLLATEIVQGLYARAQRVLTQYKSSGASVKVEREALVLVKLLMHKEAGWQLVRPDTPVLVSGFVLPAVAFDEELEELWESSQIEFLREAEAKYTHSISTVASELFFEIVKMAREDAELLNALMSVVIREMAAYGTQANEETARMRYAGLALFRTASKYIHSNDGVFSVILEDLRAPHAHVRYMAFSALQHFGYHRKMPAVVLEPFMAGVSSTDMAVVVESVLCLPHILEVAALRDALRQDIPSFIRLVLDLSNRVQIESLSSVLEDIIVLCPEEALAIAPGIASAIATSVLQLLRDGEGEAEVPEEKYEVIDGYIRTIVTLIDSLDRSPDGVNAIMLATKPMLVEVARSHQDFIPEILPIVLAATYALKSVEGMYEFLEEILKMPAEDLLVFSCEVSEVLDNYIMYGKGGILVYLGDIMRVVGEMVQGYASDYDFPYTCRVMESILLNTARLLGDRAAEIVHALIGMAVSNKEVLNEPMAAVAAVEVLICAIVMFPAMALSDIASRGLDGFLCETLREHHKRFERVHDLKLLLLFAGILLGQPGAALPNGIPADLLMQLFQYAVGALPEAIAYRESLRSGDEEACEAYYEREYMEEDPTYETPLDEIDWQVYAAEVMRTPGCLFQELWQQMPQGEQSALSEAVSAKK
ncbi:importin-7 [Nematocida homosporus]|uniref:importin-7 n=1 Tax=Nematocida homosporus TaxID=1912981 RepID=UPI00221EA690|nr:importin-7 [Nematocida homosporus]KAI5187195.1 importin-7 [Nematocida homosporus]